MTPLLVSGRGGLGDALYMRPFLRQLSHEHEVYVETSWPTVFSDLPVRPVPRTEGLALQLHHQARATAEWHTPPSTARPLSLRYRWRNLARRSVLAEMEAVSGVRLEDASLGVPSDARRAWQVACIRPSTQRLDYPQPAREPLRDYLRAASHYLHAKGYGTCWPGSTVPGIEELERPSDPCDPIDQGDPLAPFRGTVLAVAGPSWFVPAAIATGTPLVVIAGGLGGRNSPEALVDERHADAPIRWLLPEPYCRCRNRLHACNKRIPDFASRFSEAVEDLTVRRAA